MRELDKWILDYILREDYDNITFVGPNERELTRVCRNLGLTVTVYDSDPKFDNPVDAVFDDVEFGDLVVVFNAEKHYPIGLKHKGNFIIVGDNDQHNGDCNPVFSCGQLLVQNQINTNISEKQFDKHFVVAGSN